MAEETLGPHHWIHVSKKKTEKLHRWLETQPVTRGKKKTIIILINNLMIKTSGLIHNITIWGYSKLCLFCASRTSELDHLHNLKQDHRNESCIFVAFTILTLWQRVVDLTLQCLGFAPKVTLNVQFQLNEIT